MRSPPRAGWAIGPLPDEPRHVNVTAFRTCNHTGTHMDAPTHFYHGLPTIDQVPLEHCVGPAVLVDVSHVGPRGEITPVRPSRPRGRRSSRRASSSSGPDGPQHWGHEPTTSSITRCSARRRPTWLVDRGVHLIGVDTPSVDREPNPAHYAILGAHAVIVENLRALEPDRQRALRADRPAATAPRTRRLARASDRPSFH